MLKKEIILREIKRFKWLAQQTDDESEKAFYLGAAFSLNQTIGYSTRDQNRIELDYYCDVKDRKADEEIIWNKAALGDPFPITEERWIEQHPQKAFSGLIDSPEDSTGGIEEPPKRHDRIFR